MHSPMECYKTMKSCLEYALKKNIQTVTICYCMKASGLFICSSA